MLPQINLSKKVFNISSLQWKSPNVTVRSCKILFDEIRPLTEDIIEPHELLDDVIVISKTSEKSCQMKEAEKEKNDLPIVVVGSGCACAVFRGADIFAPGIMGATLTMNKDDKVLVYADLSNKLLKGWEKKYIFWLQFWNSIQTLVRYIKKGKMDKEQKK